MKKGTKNNPKKPVAKVVGIGSAGINVVDFLIANKVEGVEYVAIGTDMKSLKQSHATDKTYLDKDEICRPEFGKDLEKAHQAALGKKEEIKRVLNGSRLVMVILGLGGMTGTAIGPVIAECAKELGAFTVVVAILPFTFEGRVRARRARKGLLLLSENAHGVFGISNDNIRKSMSSEATLVEILDKTKEFVMHSVETTLSFSNLPNFMKSDFSKVLNFQSIGTIDIGIAEGPNRAAVAAQNAIQQFILHEVLPNFVRGLIISVVCPNDCREEEVSQAVESIHEAFDYSWRTALVQNRDERLGSNIMVILGVFFDTETWFERRISADMDRFPEYTGYSCRDILMVNYADDDNDSIDKVAIIL